jgi:hypothetical protein
MSRKLSELVSRKRVLQERAARERANFALYFEPIEKPLSWVDKGIDAFNFVSSTPVLWVSAFAVLAHYKPKLAHQVLAVGWGAMKLLKSAKNIVK